MTDLILAQRKSQCPGCKSMVPNEPTHKEFADMMEEGRQRMLKAEKVSKNLMLSVLLWVYN